MKNRPETQGRLILNFTSAASALDMSEEALRGRVARREVPFLKIGNRVYFDPQRLRQWIAARGKSTAADTRTRRTAA